MSRSSTAETADELLSYLWRDSKNAIFNRNKNFSAVIDAIKGAMDKHPHRKHGPEVEGETRLHLRMGSPADHSREIIVTVMAYDTPTF